MGNTTTVDSSSPTVEAYSSSTSEGYKGRFVGNSASIRLFKDNPYILSLTDSERTEANTNLLTPKQGEHFYDDDFYDWICHIETDSTSGEKSYKYTSKAKELATQMKYYESQGVLNQLISAYNNGRVYKFYVDRANLMMYPDTALSFPSTYATYTVKKQGLNASSQAVFVAGTLSDDALLETHIYLKTVSDTISGTTYRRMTAASIFGTSAPDTKAYDCVVNNNFYVVDFYNESGSIVDTKLFQAVDSAVDNIEIPSSSVTSLQVQILRGNVTQTSSSNIYPVLIGEDVSNNISYNLIAVYADGTKKIITDYINTGHVSIEGLDNVNTSSGATIGTQYTVKFTYYPTIDEDGNPIGSSVTTSVIFQVVANNYKTLYKIIPTMWKHSGNSLDTASNIYKMKIWTLTTDGVLENRTKSFYDTMKIYDTSAGSTAEFSYNYTYNPYYQCIEFAPGTILSNTIFDFNLYSSNELGEYRFSATFQSGDSDGIYIKSLTGTSEYGYDSTTGLMRTLIDTAQNECALIYGTGSTLTRFTLTSATEFYTRYARSINGTTVYPSALQIFSVKDYTYQPLTSITTFSKTAKSLTIYTTTDNSTVTTLLSELNTHDHILIKFIYTDSEDSTLVNFDTFKIASRTNG